MRSKRPRRRTKKQLAARSRWIALGLGTVTLLVFFVFVALQQTPVDSKNTKNIATPKQVNTGPKKTSAPLAELPFSSFEDDNIFPAPATAKTATPTPKIQAPTKQSGADKNLPAHTQQPPTFDKPAIALVMDDLGHQWQSAAVLAKSQHAITMAILPYSPYGQKIAKLAYASGKEVILHAPMEPTDKSSWGGGLTKDMDTHTLQHNLNDMINWLPHVVGVNNHMGSELTQHRSHMNDVMVALSKRNLFFLDSRTNPATEALNAALAHKLPSTRRDVFLDNKRDVVAIETQFQKLVSIANKKGLAVGIAHPYPETMTFIEERLPDYLDQIVLVPLSNIIAIRQYKLALNNTEKNDLKM